MLFVKSPDSKCRSMNMANQIFQTNRYFSKGRIKNSLIKPLRNPLNWNIAGHSTAGKGTSLYLIEPSIMVDAGRYVITNRKPVVPSDLLITHNHSDHIRHLDRYKKLGVDIINPTNEDADNLRNKFYAMSGSCVIVKTYELSHTVKSVGFGIMAFNGRILQKEVLILGDTLIDPFYEIPELLDYPVIVVECTNYYFDKMSMYRQLGHINWLEIRDVILKNKDIYFHLIHPSSNLSKSSKLELQSKFINGEGIENAEIWID